MRAYPNYTDTIGGWGVGPAQLPATSRTWGHDSVGVSQPATDWYLAEGCTNGGFETWVLVQNPGDEPANVHLAYMTADGGRDGPTAQVAAHTRRTFNVAETVPGTWSVSTEVRSDRPVIAERAMYGGGRAWGTDSTGAIAPARTWYLAEGCTAASFESWILVQNPGANAARVGLTYMTPSGEVHGPTVTVPARSRFTFYVADTVPECWDVSTKVTSSEPVIAERAMYWSGRKGASVSIGLNAPAGEWHFAEGSTRGGFETWVLLQNPGDRPLTAVLTYMTGSGGVGGPTVTLQPGSRKSINVADTVPNAWSVSTRVQVVAPSGQGIVAERSVYWNGRTEGHDSIGTTTPAVEWYLAEGCCGTGFETWVLVQNSGAEPAVVDLTYMTPGGAVQGPSATLGPGTRQTFNAGEYVQNEYEVSTVVRSNRPVVAERAVYGDAR